jgi:hypothetical protein
LPLPTGEQVRTLLAEGHDYRGAASQLGIPPGQACLIAAGRPAGGSGSPARHKERAGGLLASSQHLASPPHKNPTGAPQVREWIAARVAADSRLLAAAAQRTVAPQPPREPEASLGLADVLTRQRNQVRALQEPLVALPGRRAAMPEQERQRLGEELQHASSHGPTRPHRRSPEKPGAAVKAAARGAAAAGNLRDTRGSRPAQDKGRPE